jgi:hypothetical protein
MHIIAPEHVKKLLLLDVEMHLARPSPLPILFKGKCKQEEWGKNLPAGSTFDYAWKGLSDKCYVHKVGAAFLKSESS